MKYTRYNYGKAKRNNTILYLIIILLLSVFLGVALFNIVTNYNVFNNFFKVEEKLNTEINNDNGNIKISVIQCGVYSEKANADLAISKIPSNYAPFVFEEEGKYKIIAGIYTDGEINNKKEELTNLNINNFIINYNLSEKDVNDKVKLELIKGYLQIINKINDAEIESINTLEFKNWAKETTSTMEKEAQDINKIAEKINELPEEFSKKDTQESLVIIYGIIGEYNNKS